MGDGDERERIYMRDVYGIGDRGEDLWREGRVDWPEDGPHEDDESEEDDDE